MIKRILLSIVLVAGIISVNQASGQSRASATTGFDAVRWAVQSFTKNKIPPFSFVYGGQESKNFIRSWDFKIEILPKTDPSVQEMKCTWQDKKTGMSVICKVTCYTDFPAVEWVLNFKNGPGQNSPMLEKVKAIDYSFGYEKAGQVILHHSLGSDATRHDFEYLTDELTPGKPVYLTPSGGRSSDNTAFPFFNLEMPGGRGIIAAIGWTGKWYANITQTGKQSVGLESGMERLKVSLYPDEQIRTPRIALLFWKGENMDGHNQFRQFILTHHTRKINGQPNQLPFAAGLAFGGPSPCNEYSCATENYAIAMAYRYRQFNLVPEVLWIDAGWYTGCGTWWKNVGNWTVNKIAFPRGLKPVTDVVHEVGAKFILWFEPERVVKGTQWDTEHGDYLIRIPDNAPEPFNKVNKNNALFNLGNPEACAWLTKYIGDMIEKEGIDYYRQDFNFDPWYYWRYNDKPGREGMSEIRHIEGLYAYWDGLLKRFPNLIIDNCASGGRRIDLETTTRSSPLWRTDYDYGEPNGYQCHTYGLNYYLPLHGTGNIRLDPYTFRSSMSSAMVVSWDLNNGNYSQSAMQKYIADFKRLRPFYYSDYYPLTGNKDITSDSIWLAYQLNRSKEGDGIIVAFRRPGCPIGKISVKPRGLDPAANYELWFEDTNVKVTKTGKELSESLELELAEKTQSLLISYKKLIR
ncbi:MAG: alpha-galactosidase [Bacteroidales bacterium]|nr:alpha-galactosidase [Bacteroidales bacterium]